MRFSSTSRPALEAKVRRAKTQAGRKAMTEPVRGRGRQHDHVVTGRDIEIIHVGWDGSSRVTDVGAYFGGNPRVREHLDFLDRLENELRKRR